METIVLRVLGSALTHNIYSSHFFLVEHVVVGERVAWRSMLRDNIIAGLD